MDVLLQKLQQEYSKTKSQKAEGKLQDARKTTGAIRQQLDSLTASAMPDVSINIQQ